VRDAIFYQIFPDRFCNGDLGNNPAGVLPWDSRPSRISFFGGDLLGIVGKLDYLQDLGVNALYLTPIFEAPSNHKYDTTDYFRVDPAFGGDDALQKLVAALHERKMRIVLDGVFNHCSEEHPFFQKRGSIYCLSFATGSVNTGSMGGGWTRWSTSPRTS
jgi:glycosidase